MTSELWLPVVDWVGRYEVSDLGNIRSLTRTVQCRDGKVKCLRGILLAQHPKPRYLGVALARDGKNHTKYVHQLVLRAFHGPCPPGKEGRHRDGNLFENAATNLEYATHSENILDQVRHGTHSMASREWCRREHLLVLPNLVPSALVKGKRQCLACNRAASRGRRMQQRERAFDFRAEADREYLLIMASNTECA